MMLKGTIFLTDDIKVCNAIPLDGSTYIINLDEDHRAQEINPMAIEGLCLLPPIDAKIAEVDNDERRYNEIYLAHLYNQQDFLSAIIAFLYKGGNLLVYLPDEYTYTENKLCEFIFKVYGIHIGIIGATYGGECFYDYTYIPFWLNILYERNIISWEEWTAMMPLDAYGPDGVLGGNPAIFLRVLTDMNPYTEHSTPEEMAKEFRRFHELKHKNPNVKLAIGGL